MERAVGVTVSFDAPLGSGLGSVFHSTCSVETLLVSVCWSGGAVIYVKDMSTADESWLDLSRDTGPWARNEVDEKRGGNPWWNCWLTYTPGQTEVFEGLRKQVCH